jgi:hypothetical protein
MDEMPIDKVENHIVSSNSCFQCCRFHSKDNQIRPGSNSSPFVQVDTLVVQATYPPQTLFATDPVHHILNTQDQNVESPPDLRDAPENTWGAEVDDVLSMLWDAFALTLRIQPDLNPPAIAATNDVDPVAHIDAAVDAVRAVARLTMADPSCGRSESA